MSKAAVRMQKCKAGNLAGLKGHVEREYEHHTNQDIDPERSDLNIDMLADPQLQEQFPVFKSLAGTEKDYAKRVDIYLKNLNRLQERKGFTPQKFRKDATRMVDFIVTSDKAFFADKTPEQTKQFFRDATSFFQERYNNLVYATVHLDETTPHMHLGLVPIYQSETKGPRLNAKDLFNRVALRQLQTDFPQFMQAKGWKLERGIENSKAYHKKTIEYKKELRAQEAEMLSVKEVQAVPVKFQEKHGVFLEQSQFERVMNQANNVAKVKTVAKDNDRLIAENTGLQAQNASLIKKLSDLTKRAEKLEKYLETLRRASQAVYQRFLGYFRKEDHEQLRRTMSETVDAEQKKNRGDSEAYHEAKRHMGIVSVPYKDYLRNSVLNRLHLGRHQGPER